MTRVALCGTGLAAAAGTLGLEIVEDRPDLVLIDLADEAGVARAAAIDAAVPRIAVPAAGQELLIKALGSAPLAVASARTAAAIGPLLSRAAPEPGRSATRLIVIAGIAGGCGRTLLVVDLALRLAMRRVMIVDLTGSGRAAARLRVMASPWSDLEGIAGELTPEHLAVIAAERDGVRVVGGAGAMPSTSLADAVTRAATGTADLVIVDTPLVPDERAIAACRAADRVLLIAPVEAPSVNLAGMGLPASWVIASRGTAERLAGTEVFRSLPDDPAAVRAAARDGRPIVGPLGRAYDELAEIIAVDAALT